MKYVKGFTWGFYAKKGELQKASSEKSLDELISRVGIDTVTIPCLAFQEKIYSIHIDYKSEDSPSREDLIYAIKMAQSKGLRVILKAMVDVRDGTWRAFINFFDEDVICEPKWSEWFEAYTEYVNYLALIAEETCCEMLCVGCELVCSDRREHEWRKLIKDIRKSYSGLITYNCDKYQEHNVNWWDELDVISSSGYYPINEIANEIKRIENVVKKYNKPFIFMEAGCPCRIGSENNPNDWQYIGELSQEIQEKWYTRLIEESKKYDWFKGFTWWDWKASLYSLESAYLDDGYDIYGKPAEKVLKSFYSNLKKG